MDDDQTGITEWQERLEKLMEQVIIGLQDLTKLVAEQKERIAEQEIRIHVLETHIENQQNSK